VQTLFKFAFLTIAILVVLSFIGVQPLSAYKDSVIQSVKSVIGQAKATLASPANISLSNQFETEIKPTRFVQRTPHPAGLLGSSSLDPGFQVSVPSGGLPITIIVTPKKSFSGEPFTERQVGGNLITQSQPVWVLLYSQDGYLFGWNGPLTWTKDELQVKDISNERNYNVIQDTQSRSPRTVTFYINSSDKDAVALQDATEQYLKGLLTSERYLYFNRISGDFGEWLGTTDSVDKINSDTTKMTNQYFKVSVVGKDKIEELMAQEQNK
jgi:hypothetical protein